MGHKIMQKFTVDHWGIFDNLHPNSSSSF